MRDTKLSTNSHTGCCPAAGFSLRGRARGLKPAALPILLGVLGMLSALLLTAPGAAQEEEETLPPDVIRAVREGMARTLESKFRGGRTAEEMSLIAKAYANQARRARTARDRERALEKAEDRYRKWIALAENQARGEGAQADIRLAAARVEYAGMLMGLRAAGQLDQFEISAGQRGDRKQLTQWLEAARTEYGKAAEVVSALYDELGEREDEFLAAGIYDTIIQLKLDIAFNQGWANYYLGLVEPKDEQKRGAALRRAQQKFQELLDSGQTGQMLYQCHLGAAMTQRELGRYDDAERNFAYAMQEGVDPVIETQVRCELSRCHVANPRGKFAEARTVLQPLLERDLKDLPPEERAARFYINLAQLLEANSYLIEAEAVRAEAASSTARTAILRRAKRARETGLAKLNRLAAKGGPWPAIVQLYVAAGVDLRTPPAQLSSTELLYTAKQLSDAKRYKEARRRLQMALKRPESQKDPAERSADDNELGGQLLMELGKCHYRLDELRDAATTFDRLARDYRSHELAPQGATFAYQFWVEIARKSKQRQDYGHLADTLLNLLQSFPDHPDRDEAAWLLPVALQAAGRYAAAGDEFAKVPRSSKHRDEARFRRVLCGRLALEAERGSKSAAAYASAAEKAATALTGYADRAAAQIAELTETEAKDLRKWAAEARVNAAELLAGQGAAKYEPALAAVADFETQYPQSDLVGRVLAVRIRAYRGLRQFEKATQILEEYLQAVPPERTGAVLSSLARGMQEEVERLQEDGQTEAARKLAAESVDTFAQLEQWLQKDERRARNLPVVTFGRAQMLYVAGELDQAREVVTGLLEISPQNGNYQRLLARVLTAQLSDAAPVEQVTAAKDAWAELLKDPRIRKRAPQRYWEARYNWLALSLREGNPAEVEHVLKQDLVWFPDLGGPAWKEKLLALRRQARAQLGLPEEEPPSEPQEDGGPPAP